MTAPTRQPAAGFTVAETLVALLLLGAILQLCWGVAAAHRRALLRLQERSRVLDAERTVWWVLAGETTAGRAGRDWSIQDDVLSLRAFRGRGVPCGAGVDADGWLDVRYLGARQPDPVKDSVLALDPSGAWVPRDLAGRSDAAGPCPVSGAERGERWRLVPPPLRSPALLRLYERGSYHLEDRAFRYRRGAAGRQPLTDEVLDARRSGLKGTALGVEVRFRPSGGRSVARSTVEDSGWVRLLRGGR